MVKCARIWLPVSRRRDPQCIRIWFAVSWRRSAGRMAFVAPVGARAWLSGSCRRAWAYREARTHLPPVSVCKTVARPRVTLVQPDPGAYPVNIAGCETEHIIGSTSS
jgi:hypothetical protein